MQTLNKKIELIQWSSALADSEIIERLFKLRNDESKDWWNTISDDEKKSLKKGIADAENGDFVPHSEVRKMYEKWL